MTKIELGENFTIYGIINDYYTHFALEYKLSLMLCFSGRFACRLHSELRQALENQLQSEKGGRARTSTALQGLQRQLDILNQVLGACDTQ